MAMKDIERKKKPKWKAYDRKHPDKKRVKRAFRKKKG
ncbi:MAG: hypothetical protein US31_C0017G0014 [Berkelbacteria bacterium GW2011_GWA1_36_9]|uniref:Uncharacterized protein n=1 Tax=Berkelbacteria bacterium GW2011_GWA1_36_9 TaxID=1618331 RepID=A0A0G0FUW5_9BACT|nr:MAG: hypothetical protein US31_C0017G0014 [Berkelbacteria bacterium GW2011_GWA1_36_9]